MVIDSPHCSLLVRDSQLLLVTPASEDSRTDAELGTGISTVRQGGLWGSRVIQST